MKQFWTIIQVGFAAAGGWLGYFLGGCDGLLYALLAFVVADYATGVMCAVVDKSLSSRVGFRTIFSKILIFILVGVASVLDDEIIEDGSILRTAVIFFYIANEGLSILENASFLGLPFPQGLKEVLMELRDKAEKELPTDPDTETESGPASLPPDTDTRSGPADKPGKTETGSGPADTPPVTDTGSGPASAPPVTDTGSGPAAEPAKTETGSGPALDPTASTVTGSGPAAEPTPTVTLGSGPAADPGGTTVIGSGPVVGANENTGNESAPDEVMG